VDDNGSHLHIVLSSEEASDVLNFVLKVCGEPLLSVSPLFRDAQQPLLLTRLLCAVNALLH